MALNSIISFIEENSSNIEECLLTPLSNELQVVCEILSKDEIKSQISACLEELDVKAKNCTLKSESESNTYREEGNRLFREDKKANALAASRYYTNAILAAPEDSPALALAHANRAAALVEFGYYFDAYSDCEIAKNLGYPKEKQLKIIMRQAYCAVKLKNYTNLENALEKLREMPLNEQCLKQKEDFEEKLKILAELPGRWHQDQPRDYKVQNILEDPEKGRYMTAWKDYQKDNVILTEKAFAFVPVNNAKICSYCAKEQLIPYPCYSCSKVIYCSQQCKLAHYKIHKYECFAYKCNLIESLGITHLAMHTLIRGLPEILSELINFQSPEEIWEKIETITKSGKKGYPEILSSYNNLHMICPKTSRVLALGGILAANYLVTRTKFPELYEKSPCSQLNWKNLISALIFRHAVQMVANGQSGVAVTFIDKPYEYLTLADVWKQPQHLRKRLLHRFREIDANFAGMYPYLSLCNHSCEPSVRLNFDGSRLIAKARNDLKKGDEVFNSYVLDCRNNSRNNRQEELKSIYQFECDCKHCQIGNNDSEFMKFHQYRCSAPSCNKVFSPPQTNDLRWWLVIEENNEILIKCPKCKTALEVDWYIKFEDLFMAEVLDSARLTEAFRLFKYSEKIAHGFNDLRNHMAWKIVTSFFEIWEDDVVINEKFFEEVANVLNYWLNHVEEQNDVESILYATTSTFALDLMAEGKCFDFDTKKIRKSFDMLSTELKNIFENYIQDYIGEKFDDAYIKLI